MYLYKCQKYIILIEISGGINMNLDNKVDDQSSVETEKTSYTDANILKSQKYKMAFPKVHRNYTNTWICFHCGNIEKFDFKEHDPIEMFPAPKSIRNKVRVYVSMDIPCPVCNSDFDEHYMVPIDEKMIYIIHLLNFGFENLIKTSACCQGHIRMELDGVSFPYIKFVPGRTPLDVSLDFLKLLEKDGKWEFSQFSARDKSIPINGGDIFVPPALIGISLCLKCEKEYAETRTINGVKASLDVLNEIFDSSIQDLHRTIKKFKDEFDKRACTDLSLLGL